MIEFSIPLDGATLMTANWRRRNHWAEQGRITKSQRLLAEICARSQDFKAATGKRAIYLTLVRGKGQRMIDLDGMIPALKPWIDGFVDAGLLRDDSPEWMEPYFAEGRATHPALLVKVEDA